ncbi:YhgE/Pip family protein [Leucobacter luti]|uniref:YhgE/Pip family protein n=1 Tax=Leucobacter luti TaxID=340320 RepID=UPI003D091018
MSLFTRGTELKRFRHGALPKVALAVLLVIPLIYGALYLWAFWAPTDHMDRLPVAIVNLDEHAEKPDGTTLAAGDDVVDELQKGQDLDWRPLGADAAARAVSDGDVYFSVTIPRDFSETLAGLQDDPKAGQIEVVYNDNNSFLASTLGKQAMVQLRDAVGETTTRTAAEQVLVGVEKLSDGTRDAADASQTLSTGAAAVADGSGKLSAGLGELADGTSQLVGSAPELTNGTHALANGLGTARDGSAKLAAGAGELAGGAAEASAKSGQLSAGLGQLAGGAGTLAGGATDVADGSAALSGATGKLAAGAGELASRSAELSAGVGQLAAGAAQLDAGAAELAGGSAAVADGAGSLAAGAGSVADGTEKIAQLAAGNPGLTLGELDAALRAQGSSLQGLAAGAAEVSNGAADLSDGAAQLRDGAAALSEGAALLDTNTQTAAGGAAKLAGGAEDLAANLGALNGKAGELAAGAQQLAGGAQTLSSKAGEASAGGSQLAAGLNTLSGGAATLAGGSADLAGGVSTAASGADRLAAGADALAQGATKLNDGAQQAAEKSGELATGAGKVSDGAGTFAGALADGAAEAPEFADGQTVKIAETMAAPVTLAETTENEVQGFGEGFAPFFIALASFVGALITWLILRPLPRRPLASNVSGLRSVLAGFLPAALIGLGQVVIMMLVLVYGIGLEPAHWVGMASFMLLVTLAFLALQQMFIALLGTAAGRVVSLVLLMLQLSSSGGTYPVETTPGFFQALHPFMPASYVVDGLRQLIGGGIDARFWIALAVMSLVLVGSLAISAVAARRQKVWTIERLHPALAI